MKREGSKPTQTWNSETAYVCMPLTDLNPRDKTIYPFSQCVQRLHQFNRTSMNSTGAFRFTSLESKLYQKLTNISRIYRTSRNVIIAYRFDSTNSITTTKSFLKTKCNIFCNLHTKFHSKYPTSTSQNFLKQLNTSTVCNIYRNTLLNLYQRDNDTLAEGYRHISTYVDVSCPLEQLSSEACCTLVSHRQID